ncbi:helix-turn-helix domain-containing protein [Actinomadura decatromicini]|uniref:Helix-turn-helix domain-containing protein n=1 Tax=Actinomadura decatromicini TaxID=2604572 RepID=A0A5D3FH19_9ACTN|nr:helix-turn-helix domain-containing protein [Actinomadura decatromicini]TYK47166.1 helix-turn-helix domain-containing protein [Actinomadura decatromicini]
MAARRPIDDTDRRRVAELHAQGLNRNQIAREIGRAQSTVSKIAAELGLTFDRARTAEATRAKVADAKERRADLANLALDDAHAMRARALASDTGRDARDYAAAYGVFIDRHLRLIEADADHQGLAAVDAWLRDITGTS